MAIVVTIVVGIVCTMSLGTLARLPPFYDTISIPLLLSLFILLSNCNFFVSQEETAGRIPELERSWFRTTLAVLEEALEFGVSGFSGILELKILGCSGVNN